MPTFKAPDAASLVGTYVSLAAMLNLAETWGPDKSGPEYVPTPAAR